jgi:hypothetical protein
VTHPEGDRPIQALRGALDYVRWRDSQLGAAARRIGDRPRSLFLRHLLREVCVLHAHLNRQARICSGIAERFYGRWRQRPAISVFASKASRLMASRRPLSVGISLPSPGFYSITNIPCRQMLTI